MQLMKASPDSATSEMGTFCSKDMKPRMEKIAKPATKLVPLFRKHNDRQSLQQTENMFIVIKFSSLRSHKSHLMLTLMLKFYGPILILLSK